VPYTVFSYCAGARGGENDGIASNTGGHAGSVRNIFGNKIRRLSLRAVAAAYITRSRSTSESGSD
jgi:hypothetical protein